LRAANSTIAPRMGSSSSGRPDPLSPVTSTVASTLATRRARSTSGPISLQQSARRAAGRRTPARRSPPARPRTARCSSSSSRSAPPRRARSCRVKAGYVAGVRVLGGSGVRVWRGGVVRCWGGASAVSFLPSRAVAPARPRSPASLLHPPFPFSPGIPPPICAVRRAVSNSTSRCPAQDP